MRTARLELDPNDDDMMEKFNEKLIEVQRQFDLGTDDVDLTYEQAAAVLGMELFTIVDYAGRGIVRRGSGKKTVHIDDVVQRLLSPRKTRKTRGEKR